MSWNHRILRPRILGGERRVLGQYSDDPWLHLIFLSRSMRPLEAFDVCDRIRTILLVATLVMIFFCQNWPVSYDILFTLGGRQQMMYKSNSPDVEWTRGVRETIGIQWLFSPDYEYADNFLLNTPFDETASIPVSKKEYITNSSLRVRFDWVGVSGVGTNTHWLWWTWNSPSLLIGVGASRF